MRFHWGNWTVCSIGGKTLLIMWLIISCAEVVLAWGVLSVKSKIWKNKVRLFVKFKTKNDDHCVPTHCPLFKIENQWEKW